MKIRVAGVVYNIKLQFVATTSRGDKVYETRHSALRDFFFLWDKKRTRFAVTYDPGSLWRWSMRRRAEDRGERTAYMGRFD